MSLISYCSPYPFLYTLLETKKHLIPMKILKTESTKCSKPMLRHLYKRLRFLKAISLGLFYFFFKEQQRIGHFAVWNDNFDDRWQTSVPCKSQVLLLPDRAGLCESITPKSLIMCYGKDKPQ